MSDTVAVGKDSHWRSMAKSASWRLVALVITAIVALILTENWRVALSIGGVDGVVKIGAYYFHERAWQKTNFLRNKPPEYNI